MLYRFFRFLVLGVIFYGVGLALLGLFGSTQQAFSGFINLFGGGLGLPGAQVVVSRVVPVSGAPANDLASPTPFQPVPPTATSTPRAATAIPRQPATPVPSPTPSPTATVRPIGAPDRIVIDKIDLDAPVVIMPRLELVMGRDVFEHWQPPGFFAAGWNEGSAFLGEKGNTVLSGHHNIDGMVFARLHELERGDTITVYAGDRPYHYVVTQAMLFEERFVSIEQRVQNAHWILPSDDERLTLVTCWPPESNTYRLIVVAAPAD